MVRIFDQSLIVYVVHVNGSRVSNGILIKTLPPPSGVIMRVLSYAYGFE